MIHLALKIWSVLLPLSTFYEVAENTGVDRKINTGSFEDSANLPDPDIIAAEIDEDLEAALSEFPTIAADLETKE
jgi:hypothetical protein